MVIGSSVFPKPRCVSFSCLSLTDPESFPLFPPARCSGPIFCFGLSALPPGAHPPEYTSRSTRAAFNFPSIRFPMTICGCLLLANHEETELLEQSRRGSRACSDFYTPDLALLLRSCPLFEGLPTSSLSFFMAVQFLSLDFFTEPSSSSLYSFPLSYSVALFLNVVSNCHFPQRFRRCIFSY